MTDEIREAAERYIKSCQLKPECDVLPMPLGEWLIQVVEHALICDREERMMTDLDPAERDKHYAEIAKRLQQRDTLEADLVRLGETMKHQPRNWIWNSSYGLCYFEKALWSGGHTMPHEAVKKALKEMDTKNPR